jgi:hypothetical protein
MTSSRSRLMSSQGKEGNSMSMLMLGEEGVLHLLAREELVLADFC